jgi:hypothetical protein
VKTNPNDLAFAGQMITRHGSDVQNGSGLTKREYFAAMALNKLARANRHPERLKVISEICIAQADALISELNNQSSSEGAET